MLVLLRLCLRLLPLLLSAVGFLLLAPHFGSLLLRRPSSLFLLLLLLLPSLLLLLPLLLLGPLGLLLLASRLGRPFLSQLPLDFLLVAALPFLRHSLSFPLFFLAALLLLLSFGGPGSCGGLFLGLAAPGFLVLLALPFDFFRLLLVPAAQDLVVVALVGRCLGR